jgi:hypothetical protein
LTTFSICYQISFDVLLCLSMDLLAEYGSSEDDADDPVSARRGGDIPEPLSTKHADAPITSTRLRRGPKILSLQAVLPPHIFERLTQSSGVSHDDDSDDDDNDVSNERQRRGAPERHSTQTTVSSTPASSLKGTDPGLSDLLSALRAAPTAGSILRAPSKPAGADSQPLGAAFLSSSSTTTTKVTTSSTTIVRDIHGTAATRTDDRGESDIIPVVTTTTTPARRVPLAAAPRVSAAPLVSRTIPPSNSLQSSSTASDPTARPTNDNNKNDDEYNHTRNPSNPPSRKALEQALRHGNLSAVWDDPNRISVAQAAPDRHTPVPERAAPSHGVKVVPTALYDPSVGANVLVNTTGGRPHLPSRGKNQIHTLLQSAAALERQRAQQGGVAGSATLGKTHRANAKRKYGW